jgi:hypothetical protein
LRKSVKVIPFPGITDAYVVISGGSSKGPNGCETIMSFFWGDREGGCEWEPQFGPFTKITPCDSQHPDALPHWFYEFCTGYGNWTQLAVEDTHIVEYFLNGDYLGVFKILQEYAHG